MVSEMDMSEGTPSQVIIQVYPPPPLSPFTLAFPPGELFD